MDGFPDGLKLGTDELVGESEGMVLGATDLLGILEDTRFHSL